MPNRRAENVSWTHIASRLEPSRSYWLGTSNRDNSPHVAPVWGVVVDERLYIFTERTTVKSRNLGRDSRSVVHLEKSEDVVIVHGHFDDLGTPQVFPSVMETLARKYDRPEDAQYLPSADPSFDVLYRLRPQKALLWNLGDYDNSQQRWTGPSIL
jgi:hypothetical protein